MSLEEVQYKRIPIRSLSFGDVFKSDTKFFIVDSISTSGIIRALDLTTLADQQLTYFVEIDPMDNDLRGVSVTLRSIISIDIKIRQEG